MESAWSLMRDNASLGMKKACDLFVQAGFATSDEVNALYNQMMIDFYAEDFHGMWHYATIQGVKPA